MIEMGQEFKQDWEGRPPGMSRIDRAIWHRYSKENMNPATDIFYNVRIGPMPKGVKKYPPNMRRHWWQLCCRRIDAVIMLPNQTNIYEIRNNATENAIARLMIYSDLWEKELPEEQPPELFLITNIENQGIRGASKAQNIKYCLVT